MKAPASNRPANPGAPAARPTAGDRGPTPQAPRALITGITGQDGSFLAELLLAKGYGVSGLVRSPARLGCAEHLRGEIELIGADSLCADVRRSCSWVTR